MRKTLDKLKRWLRSKKFWKRFAFLFIGLPILLFSILVLIVYIKQDEIVQSLMADMNKDFRGSAEIEDSHVSMFENFPYISIDLEHFVIYENKEKNTTPIIDVHDTYVGFNLWTILSGKMEVKKIKLVGGQINLIQHKNGEFNIVKALTPEKEIESAEEEFHLDLKKIELHNIDLTKLNEENDLKIEALISDAHSTFETSDKHVKASLDARFVLNLIKDGDTTFLKHKHIDFDTEIDFLKGLDILTISPTAVHLEDSEFTTEGSIDFLNDMDLDLSFSGNKSDFELFIAMAPEHLIPTLKTYDNKGEIYLNGTFKGPSLNGHNPAIHVNFGCKNGLIKKDNSSKRLKNLNFSGYFTNGKEHTMESSKFALHDFGAKPRNGKFYADVVINDFTAPQIDAKLESSFEMDFIAKFFDLKHIDHVRGSATINLDFKDIIDLENPHHAISKLNESYKMKVQLKNLSFDSDVYDLPVEDFDFLTTISGHKATIKQCNLKIGKSDLKIYGSIDDLPAIMHHTDIPVDTRFKIFGDNLDLFELTGSNETSIDEQIEDYKLDLDFKASARSFTECKYLPVGEFFIENMYGKLKHYPHTLHDFHADIFVEEHDLRVVDFKGMIDKSDFLFTGKLEHYEKWLDEHPGGNSKIEFNLASNMLQFESLFSYKGENFVPEDYRHEELDNLHVHGYTYLHYQDGLKSMDLNIDKFDAKMKIHPLRFQNFYGRVHYEDDHLMIEDFHGKLGESSFKTTLHYYMGDNPTVRKRDNHLSITATRLDFDQLIKYNPAPIKPTGGGGSSTASAPKVNHDAGFNIYELPFTDMTYHLDIGHFNYHRFLFHNIKGNLRTTENHYIYVEHLNLDAAGGHFAVDGYFNGSDPDMIYFSPTMNVRNIDLDKLLFKFDNFGQDHLVSENLHGKFSGTITGKIHMHNDLVPKIDDSEIHIDAYVSHGKLENYALLTYMSDFFKDKNMNKVLFDTLNNHIDMVNGVMKIPEMTINSSLGHLIISGEQRMNGEMEYRLQIPWKMVSKTGASKLFGHNNTEEELAEQTDEIQYGTDKTRYVNIHIKADANGYKFSLGKKRKKKWKSV
jgi:hypothetical protein